MAKDPAFLFYSNDFLEGTFTFSDEQTGKYIKLLCLQHQRGKLTKKDMLHICKTYDEDIFGKFKEQDGFYVNLKLQSEAEKRRLYSESRRKNRKTNENETIEPKETPNDKSYDETYDETYDKSYDEHMENRVRDVIVIENDSDDSDKKKIDFDLVLLHWNNFAKQMGIPEIKSITEDRKKKILTRSKEIEFDFMKIITEIMNSDFLLGKVNNFKVSFDWIFKSTKNYLKILEGNYRNGDISKSNSGNFKGFDPRKNSWITGT